MTREEMHDYMIGLPHTVCDYKEEWDAFLYRIDGKFFALMSGSGRDVPAVSLKCSPVRAVELRNQFDDIKPGYYLNKTHWNTVNINNSLDDGLMKDLMRHSYELVFNKLTKKRQKELNGD